MLVSERGNGEKTWEHFGAERVVIRLVDGVPRLYCSSRRRTPLYFREFTFRPQRAAEFLHDLAMKLQPRQELDSEGWMARAVLGFAEAHPQWATWHGSWKNFFLQAHVPLLKKYPRLQAEEIPGPLIEGFRLAEPEALAFWLSGSRGKKTRNHLYQHLVEALQQKKPNWGKLLHLRMLRGLGTTADQVREVLAWPEQEAKAQAALWVTPDDLVCVRRLLRRVPEPRRFGLVKDNYFSTEPTWTALAETSRRWFQQPKSLQDEAFGGASTIHELQGLADNVECQRNNRPIRPTAWARRLGEVPLGRWSLEAPSESETLAVWGQEFKNCAARFAAPVVAGKTNVIRVLKDSKPLYLLEVQDRKLVQFLGHANQPPDPEDRCDLVGLLADHGMLDRIDLMI